MAVSLVLYSVYKRSGFSVSSNILTKIGVVWITINERGFDRIGLEYRKFALREINNFVNSAHNDFKKVHQGPADNLNS